MHVYIPPLLELILISLHLGSLCMLVVVMIQWRRRLAEGALFGSDGSIYPWPLHEVVQFVAVLLLVYGQMSLLGAVLERTKLLTTDRRTAFFIICFQTGVYLVVFLWIRHSLRRMGISWKRAFGFGAGSVGNVFLTAGITLAAVIVPVKLLGVATKLLFEFNHWAIEPQPVLELLARLDDPWLKGGLVLFAVVAGPIVEEIIFRGILYPCLKSRVGFIHALWISSLLFAAIHRHAISMPPLFCLAAALALLYEWRGNLAACMVMHAGFNALNLTMLWIRDIFTH